MPELRIFEDLEALSIAACEAAVHLIDDALSRQERCSLVLSGGHTPRRFYTLLASRFGERRQWQRIHVFWGDERYVPHTDPLSNYRMAKETLLDHVPCPAENVHPMPTHFGDPGLAAREYELTLRRSFDGEWPRFDLVLLGLGDDGHTASLFPGSPALEERTRWAVATEAPKPPHARLTLTLPVFNAAANAYFLVEGASKQLALRHILSGLHAHHPAADIELRNGAVVWWVDRAAAP